jgi:hypothetical protein
LPDSDTIIFYALVKQSRNLFIRPASVHRSSFIVLRQYAARGKLHEESFVAVDAKSDILVHNAWNKFGNA